MTIQHRLTSVSGFRVLDETVVLSVDEFRETVENLVCVLDHPFDYL